jgi:hypothetical protein
MSGKTGRGCAQQAAAFSAIDATTANHPLGPYLVLPSSMRPLCPEQTCTELRVNPGI